MATGTVRVVITGVPDRNLEMRTMAVRSQSTSLGRAAVLGAVAGLAGGAALLLTEQAGRRTILPNGSDTESTAARAVEAVASEHEMFVSRARAEIVGESAELAWCAALGALFGVVRSRVRVPALLDSLALAGLAYAATSSSRGLLPRLGLAPALGESVEEAAIPIASHVAFAVTTAAVFEATV
jgi:hypothetical protein